MFRGVLKSTAFDCIDELSSGLMKVNIKWSILCGGLFSSIDILQGSETF